MNRLKLIRDYCDVQSDNTDIWTISATRTSREKTVQEELFTIIWMIEEASEEEILNKINLAKEIITLQKIIHN